MELNSATELTEVERLTRQLHLINDSQVDSQEGSIEYEPGKDYYFWSDSMFILHGLPVAPHNTITLTDAEKFVHKADRALVREQRHLLEQLEYVDFYFRIVTPGGHIKSIHAVERKTVIDGVTLYRATWRDENYEKRFQQPLKEEYEKLLIRLKIFERAEEVAQAGSWQINLETFETIYSDNVYRIHGLASQSIAPHVDAFRKYIHPEDRPVVLKMQEKSYVEMIPLHLEYRIIREDGEVRYISQVSHLLKNEKGEHLLSGNTRDITEHKLLEIQLREANDILTLQNELFMQAEKIGSIGTWQVNMSTRKAVYSANLFRLYGMKPYSAQPGLENFINYIHPDDRDLVRRSYSKAFEEHIAPELTFRITRADGKPRILRQESRFIKGSEGELMMGVLHDITNEKEQERLLKETNSKLTIQNEIFRHAEKVASIGSWTWNLQTNEIAYSDNVYLIYGLKPQSILPGFEQFGRYMHPDDRERMKKMPEEIRTRLEPITVEYRIIRPDGSLRYLRSRNQPITTGEAQTIIIGTTQDVTEEVILQQQLLDKIQFAEVLGNAMPDRIMVTDTANNIISWNKSCETIYGMKKENVLGRNFFDVLPFAKVPQVIDRFNRALGGETIHVPIMATLQVPGYQELLMVPFKDQEGSVIGVLHLLHDITHQQQLQQQLTNRLQFIEKLQEATIDRIMVLDANLYFQLWNRQCEQYYGLPKENVIGKHILEVFPRFKTDPLYQHCLQALDGETVHVPANEREGISGYQESYLIPLRNEVKDVTGLLWIVHDLTERFIAEHKLRTNEAHLKAAQEIALMGSFEIDVPPQKIKWSEPAYSILDYPAGTEINFETMLERVHPYDRSMVEDIITSFENPQVRETLKSWNPEQQTYDAFYRILSSSGQTKHLHLRGQATMKDGQILYVTGIIQDITEKRLAEDIIRKSEALFRQAEELAHLGSWEYNNTDQTFYWSDGMFRLYGYGPQSFTPSLKFLTSVVSPADRDNFFKAMENAQTRREEFSLIQRITTLDGRLLYLQVAGRPITDGAGKVTAIVGMALDVTAQRSLAEELKKNADRMRVQYTLDRQAETIRNLGTWQLDINKGIMIWGGNLFRLLGFSPYECHPDLETFIGAIHPDDRQAMREQLNAGMEHADGLLPMLEYRVGGNEQVRYFRSSCKIYTSASGRMIIGTVQDVTEDVQLRKQLADLNRSLQKTNKELQEMNEELSSFAFVASHDLREPLRKVQMFSRLINDKEAANLSEKGRDYFNRMQSAVRRMEQLIEDILNFSRIHTSADAASEIDLNQVIKAVKTDMFQVISATGADIRISKLPCLWGNYSHFYVLLQNLLSNALKYQAPGNVPVVIVHAESLKGSGIDYPNAAADTDYIRISVTDNGIGFEEQYAKKIFQMFQRLHGIHEYPGTGMGLAICKKIVERHNGFIVACSKPGEGATFECYFPLSVNSSAHNSA